MEDREIVALYLERDEAAIRQTSEKYGGRLRALAFGIVKDAQTAEECENDAYEKTWNAIPPHEPGEYLYAFLARIVRNLSLDYCRRRSRLKRDAFVCELSAEMEQCIPTPDDCECRLDNMALSAALNGFLDTLSAEKRNVFLRRYWYLDSIAALADRFQISQGQVKSRLHRTRLRLKDVLLREGVAV